MILPLRQKRRIQYERSGNHTKLHEKDEKGLITVYVSYVDRSEGETKLYGVDDEAEWNKIKDVLRELAKTE